MTATLDERDPLAPSLLPTFFEREISTDVASGAESRPFGLTLTTVVPESEKLHITGLRYDHDRQVTVTPDGTPLTANPLVAGSTCTVTTKSDSQTWDDKESDD